MAESAIFSSFQLDFYIVFHILYMRNLLSQTRMAKIATNEIPKMTMKLYNILLHRPCQKRGRTRSEQQQKLKI